MIDSNYMSEFTFEKEWAERRGLLLVLAFFLGGLGGGLYLVSTFVDFFPGIVVAFFVVAVGKGGSHMLYLGRPMRFWRAFLRPQSSWISRGIIAVVAFIVFVGLQLLISLLPGGTEGSLYPMVQLLAIASAIVLMAYTGFALGVVNAIPFWNSALMPVLFIISSVLGGAALTLGMASAMGSGAVDVALLETAARWLLVIAAFTIGIYLWISYHVNPAAKYSVRELLEGRVSLYFVGGVVVLGLVVPLAVGLIGLLYGEVSPAVTVLAALSELVGGFSLRYSILKAGVYAPVV